MKQEDKELLIKDLCGRLPYGVILDVDNGKYREDKKIWPGLFNSDSLWDAKPYLRPMSSMTEEEKEEFDKLINLVEERCINAYGKGGYSLTFTELNDWLNAHHFDYRVLISMGLALEASEDMYKID